jgi:hypothetical protein
MTHTHARTHTFTESHAHMNTHTRARAARLAPPLIVLARAHIRTHTHMTELQFRRGFVFGSLVIVRVCCRHYDERLLGGREIAKGLPTWGSEPFRKIVTLKPTLLLAVRCASLRAVTWPFIDRQPAGTLAVYTAVKQMAWNVEIAV